MTVSALKTLFFEELSGLYSNSENDILFGVFAEKILGLNKISLRNSASKELSDEKKLEFLRCINFLKSGRPYQQILGETEFYGLKFFVSENVLIPRPETEELLELAIEKILNLKSEVSNLKILDIGTGSGIIPIVLKKHFPDAEISSIDISEKALKIARKNADFHQTQINFIHADYLALEVKETFDIIISNPPYIGNDELAEIENTVKNFEPLSALFSPTADPLIFYRKIAVDAAQYLSANGIIFLEINQKLGSETLELFKNFSESTLQKDLSGNVRFIIVQK